MENVQTVLNYATMGDGPLTVMGGVEGLAFINTKYANHSVDQPDIELHFVSGSTNSDGGVQLWKAHGLKEEFYKTVYEPINNKDVWSAIPVSIIYVLVYRYKPPRLASLSPRFYETRKTITMNETVRNTYLRRKN